MKVRGGGKRIRLHAARAFEIGSESRRSVNQVFARQVTLACQRRDRHRTETEHLAAVEQCGRDLVGAAVALRAVLVDFVEENVVVSVEHGRRGD